MQLVTFTHAGETRIGAIREGFIVDLQATDASLPSDMLSLLRGGDAMLALAKAAAEQGEGAIALTAAKLESPIQNPEKVLAVGLNYLDHFYEIPEHIRQANGMKPPTTPIIFNKQTTSVNGPFDPILLPSESQQMDYEAELAVVIGKTCRRVSPEQAFEAVVGYTILNDVTIRDWQIASPTMTMGKSWDSHCPMGPALFTKDEITQPENLTIKMLVNGIERQNFNSADMIFGIADQIAYLSTAFTLRPGDIIATGTSAGVAIFTKGQPWLIEGDVARVEIEGMGYIENRVEKDTVTSFIK